MPELAARVDELQVDLLQGALLGVGQQRLPQGQHTLLGPDATSLRTSVKSWTPMGRLI